ncbi:MAG: hypothetical protein ACOZIN_15175 [Myxococcota bacterium]
MKQKRLAEVRALVAQPELQDWWAKLLAAREEARVAKERYDELLSQTILTEFRAELTQKNAIDTLHRAGECEDSAATLLFEATVLENQSFQAVSDFEEQRFKVSELWYRLGAAEKNLEDDRAAVTAKAKKAEENVRSAERALRIATEEYERETAKKNRLWDEVERLWAKSAEVNLLVSEQRSRGQKVRKEAEKLFALAEERKLRTKELHTEADVANGAVEAAEAKIRHLHQEARERFGCAVGTDFLYFRQKESQKLAYCVSLVEDREGYNIEVKPLAVYSVERQRGVAFLEPARAEAPSVEEGDRRFEEYFLTGRKGEAHPARS